MNTEFDMSGKVAMVTGASSGFGVHFSQDISGPWRQSGGSGPTR